MRISHQDQSGNADLGAVESLGCRKAPAASGLSVIAMSANQFVGEARGAGSGRTNAYGPVIRSGALLGDKECADRSRDGRSCP